MFVALADPTRRRLLDVLAASGEATATALAAIKRLAEADEPPR